MARKTETEFKGRKVATSDLDFKTVSEEWNEYELEDGTRMRLKTVVSKILRLEGTYNADGDPVYQVVSTNILAPDIPPGLKMKPSKKDVN